MVELKLLVISTGNAMVPWKENQIDFEPTFWHIIYSVLLKHALSNIRQLL